ncbi:MAG: hypothetical protein NT107_03770 [Planctomycetota bacterium]|nr:hypothetical protein [Planctomycetota bacterium]
MLCPVRYGPLRYGPVRYGPVRFGPVRYGPFALARSLWPFGAGFVLLSGSVVRVQEN